LSHLTKFLSDTIDDKNEQEKEMIDAVSRFNEERRKSLIILKSPLTTTTTSYPDYIDDDLFSKDDFDYEDDGVTIPDYYQYEEANQSFRFSFKQQQVQPPITTTRRTTSTSRPSRRPETTTSLFVDTPFRLKLDPVSGLFKTVKDNGFLR